MVLAVNWPPQAPAAGRPRFELAQVGIGDLAGRVLADALEHVDHGDVLAAQLPGRIEPP